MQYDFDQSLSRGSSESFKWRTCAADVLPLSVADMDFVSPEPVVRALREYVDRGVFGYPRGLYTSSAAELPELAEAVVERMAQRYKWQVALEDLVFIPGVVTGLNLACHAVASEGGSVLVQPPVYPPILSAPGNARLRRLDAELQRQNDGTYAVDWDDLALRMASDTRMLIFCNPQNPVGRVFRRDELYRTAEICLSRNVTICSDEIHSDLVFSGREHVPIASIDRDVAQQTITFIAPSKTFNLPGLQCSIAIVQNPQLRQRFQAAREGLVPWVNTAGLIAAQAAYRGGQEWLDQVLIYLEANRDFLWDFVRREMPNITMTNAEGTYLAWLDCREAKLDNPFQFFLDRARVALSDGLTFGRGGEGFVRLNFACPRSLLRNALQRMRQAIAR